MMKRNRKVPKTVSSSSAKRKLNGEVHLFPLQEVHEGESDFAHVPFSECKPRS